MEKIETSSEFTAAVERAFGFLRDEFEFRLTHADDASVRYESGAVVVDIYHGRSSFELGMQAGQVKSAIDESYSMSELIRLSSPKEAARYRNYVARTPDAVRTGIALLASLARQYAPSVLSGDAKAFERLGALRQQWKAAMDENSKRTAASEAWVSGRLREAALLYESLGESLTGTERKRLAYLRAHGAK